MSDVWALKLLPVIKKKAPGIPGVPSRFTAEQDAVIVDMREQRQKEWGEIARAVNRPLSSVHQRYRKIVAGRPQAEPVPVALSAAVPEAPARLHEELGIRTYTVEHDVVDGAGRKGSVTRRVSITLSAGII